MEFKDRHDAGRVLASALGKWRGQPDLVVLALPRGGVPVAWEVARALQAPLDVLVVRKLGLPGQEELAMGAIGPGGVRVMSDVARMWPVSDAEVEQVIAREQAELARRERLYRGERAPLALAGRVVLLVDDGLATGASMHAAVLAVRAMHAQRIVVAVPVGSREAVQLLETVADEVVCVHAPEPFRAVGIWYENFGQTSDEEVRGLLQGDGA
ncbi:MULTISPECIES: phosphoribosyltransferase [unclassified Variovorax]|jgi:predicted phosphoribosyltransferase|uniref:phosphoribosyltransferase n=1 Tax=unclassified Variovorax TaxID=663243 RepID=UPI00076D8874|nr:MULTISPECIES: phosphoribosyltransferase [unclassified Variovorax]KWT97384.1 Erythromycin esterase [Variovorax sp. WDL1]PNG60056.1 putative phosphoribosyl transferase [Variovorax sp. B4]PNG60151.1 putative phosphoribosyl transferase [Variovorax sp. B2]VTV14028.1 Putative phosphoribosyl transferasec/MT0597 [Variovorax sp. WDL1]